MLNTMDSATIDQAYLERRMYKRASDSVYDKLDGAAVLLEPATGTCYGLEGTAAMERKLVEFII